MLHRNAYIKIIAPHVTKVVHLIIEQIDDSHRYFSKRKHIVISRVRYANNNNHSTNANIINITRKHHTYKEDTAGTQCVW